MDPLQTPSAQTSQPVAPMPPPSLPPQHSGNLKLVISILVLLVILGLTAWFVWPIPQMSAQQTEEDIYVAFSQNDVDGAIAQADAALVRDPGNISLLLAKAVALAQKGSLTFNEEEYGVQAAAVAQEVLRVDPDNAEAWRLLGYSHEIREEYAKAHEYYAKALSFDPQNQAALFGDAHAYELQGDMAKAEAGYLAVLAINDSFGEAHMGLGKALASKGDLEGAISEFKRAYETIINLRSKAEAAYSIGIFSLMKSDYQTALRYTEDATKIDPTFPLGWYGFAAALLRQALFTQDLSGSQREGLIREAVTHLSTAVRLNPNQTIAYIEMARTQYSIMRNYEGALETLASAERVLVSDITLSVLGKQSAAAEIAEMRTAIKDAQTP